MIIFFPQQSFLYFTTQKLFINRTVGVMKSTLFSIIKFVCLIINL